MPWKDSAGRVQRATCRGAARHWFAYRGQVGSSRPTCDRCGAPNPNYRPDDDPQAPKATKIEGT
jgi:hypothetical protein